ncbi:hypothetical protein Vqi01_27140 [Micromonospora qiuiae]|uniref:Uncharacterized protein n=1 Tax=Micromonospora qiuiae TaxID=502268 RepID=A0ABQ4JBL0_9ACTN|nr:hypothetical protein Vqi01_27140 [Micromonospora qiuiae]
MPRLERIATDAGGKLTSQEPQASALLAKRRSGVQNLRIRRSAPDGRTAIDTAKETALAATLLHLTVARARLLSTNVPDAPRQGDGVADLSDLSIGGLDRKSYRQRLTPERGRAFEAQLDIDPAGTAGA